MKNALPYIFFLAWMLCSCSVDQALDDWRATLIFVIAFATAILCAVALGTKEK